MPLTLYIDGDALPNALKSVLLGVIKRFQLETFVVSNKRINIGESHLITYIIVEAGFDEADQRIVDMVKAGDLIITADIPLADHVITKQAHALDHRGKFFTTENIKQSLAIRNLMQGFRDIGEITRGPAPFKQKDIREFANQLNNFLTRQKLR